jgi:transposase
MSVLPCRPYTPQHKGKVERGVGYVKGIRPPKPIYREAV